MPRIKSKQIKGELPVLPNDLTTKSYVDDLISNIDSSSLSVQLSSEISDRINNDSSLSTIISSETSNRIDGNNSLYETIIDINSKNISGVTYSNKTLYFNQNNGDIINIDLNSGSTALLSYSNRNMIAENTSYGNTLACLIPFNTTNIPNSSLIVYVNGVQVNLGSDDYCDCYFSSDGGITKKQLNQIIIGDFLYWNYNNLGNPISEYDLSNVDRITFISLKL